MDNTVTSNDNLPGVAFNPAVGIAHLALSAEVGSMYLGSMNLGSMNLGWRAEAGKGATEKELADFDEIIPCFPVNATGVPTGPQNNPGDAGICAAAINRLHRDLAVPRNAVQVEVRSGAVTLTGEVEWQDQWLAAGMGAAGPAGVTSVCNQIKVGGESSYSRLCDQIQPAGIAARLFDPKIVQFCI